jgi:hypothetical protein
VFENRSEQRFFMFLKMFYGLVIQRNVIMQFKIFYK